MEMCHVIIKYPEVFNDLNFVAILTLPLDICAGTDCKREIFVKLKMALILVWFMITFFVISN